MYFAVWTLSLFFPYHISVFPQFPSNLSHHSALHAWRRATSSSPSKHVIYNHTCSHLFVPVVTALTWLMLPPSGSCGAGEPLTPRHLQYLLWWVRSFQPINTEVTLVLKKFFLNSSLPLLIQTPSKSSLYPLFTVPSERPCPLTLSQSGCISHFTEWL